MLSTVLEFLTSRRPGRPGIRGWIHCSMGAALLAGVPACSSGLNLPRAGQDHFTQRSFQEAPVGNASVAARSPGRATISDTRSFAPVSNKIQQVGYQQKSNGPQASPAFRIHSVASEVRRPSTPFDTSGDDEKTLLALAHPDEYLFDGGDRDYPIHYDARGRAGVETEDTYAEFRDEAGKLRINPTNRVAIYAPRFANVTTISHASEGVAVGHLEFNSGSLNHSALRNRVVPGLENKPEKLQAVVERIRGSEVKDGLASTDTHQQVRLSSNVHTIYTEAFAHFAKTGELLNSEEPRLAEALQSAVALTRKQHPFITAKFDSAADVKSHFRDAEVVGLKENPLSAGRLRIVKLADKHIVESGDVVTFTIRFDNQGHRPLTDLVITDNLTPRLQYVPDSATSDRAGRLVAEENGQGSLILRWELDDPLPGRAGGVVTFQARVK